MTSYRYEERFSNITGTGIQLRYVSVIIPSTNIRAWYQTYEELHLRDFLIHLFHELDNKVDKLVLQHGFGVEVGDQERDIIALAVRQQSLSHPIRLPHTNLYWLPPQDEERFRALRQESRELVDKDMLDFIRLLYTDAHTDTVDTGFDEDSLVLVARNGQGIEEKFGGRGSLDFRHVMSFGRLRSEVGNRKSRGQRRADTLEVRAQ